MIRNLPVDAGRLPLLAAAPEAEPAPLWGELSDGSRRPIPGKQATTEQGVPLWQVDVLAADPSGQGRPEVVTVSVASPDAPRVQHLAPVAFVNLTARVSVGRDGKLRAYWNADGVQHHGGKGGE